jgi:hypothetical protein
MMRGMDEHELPPDPDLDDLPRELAEREGPLVISGVDPEDGTQYAAYIRKDELAAGFADARRLREDDDL